MLVIRHPLGYLVATVLTLHNLEEALTFPSWLPLIQARSPVTLRPWLGQVSVSSMYFGLVIATVVPWVVGSWSARRPSNRFALWLVLLIQAVVLANTLWHIFAAGVLIRAYVPGLITAAIVNLPFSTYVFHRVVRERWFSRRALLALVPAAVLVHGLVVMTVMYFGVRMTDT